MTDLSYGRVRNNSFSRFATTPPAPARLPPDEEERMAGGEHSATVCPRPPRQRIARASSTHTPAGGRSILARHPSRSIEA